MATKSMYTKELGREIARRAREVTGNYFVIPGIEKSRWMVVRQRKHRPSRVFTNKVQAIAFAKASAAPKRGEVFIQDRNAMTERTISF